MKLLPPLLLLLLSTPCFADLNVAVKQLITTETVTPTIVTQLTLEDGTTIGEPIVAYGEPTVKEGGYASLLLLVSDRDLTDPKTTYVRIKCKTAVVKKYSPDSYIVSTPGKHEVEIMVIGLDPLFIEEITTTVINGEPIPPEPIPLPVPPVPEDEFDNIGQRVAEWSAGIAGAKKAASVYRTTANLLSSDPTQTINSASAYLVDELKKLPEYNNFTQVRSNINADLTQRWDRGPMSRGTLADYYNAIAAGLEAGL